MITVELFILLKLFTDVQVSWWWILLFIILDQSTRIYINEKQVS